MNPDLEKSPFILDPHPLSKDVIRFRLGSHVLPIETGRWSRKPRQDRLCVECGVLGDERHAIFHCQRVDRRNITLPDQISDVWKMDTLYELMQNMKDAGFLDWDGCIGEFVRCVIILNGACFCFFFLLHVPDRFFRFLSQSWFLALSFWSQLSLYSGLFVIFFVISFSFFSVTSSEMFFAHCFRVSSTFLWNDWFLSVYSNVFNIYFI